MKLLVEADWQLVGGVHVLSIGKYEAMIELVDRVPHWYVRYFRGHGILAFVQPFNHGTAEDVDTAKQLCEAAISIDNGNRRARAKSA